MSHRETQHELWLAMRTAYLTYRHAAEAFDAAVSGSPQPFSTLDRTARATILAAAQLAAFENYVEARLGYSEFLRDSDRILAAAEQNQEPEDNRKANTLFTRPVLTSVGVVLLGIVGLSYAFFAHERKRAGFVALADDHVPERHIPVQPVPGPVVGKIDTLNATHKQNATEVATASPALHSTPPATSPKNTGQKPAVQIRHARTKPLSKSRQLSLRRHNDYDFELTPSQKFTQVGAVSMSLRKVDVKRRSLDLLIRVDRSKLLKKHLRLNVPIWVLSAEDSRPKELVATAINRNDVHLHLSQSDNYRRRFPGVACTSNCLVGSSNQARQEVGRAGFSQGQMDIAARRPAGTNDDSAR